MILRPFNDNVSAEEVPDLHRQLRMEVDSGEYVALTNVTGVVSCLSEFYYNSPANEHQNRLSLPLQPYKCQVSKMSTFTKTDSM